MVIVFDEKAQARVKLNLAADETKQSSSTEYIHLYQPMLVYLSQN